MKTRTVPRKPAYLLALAILLVASFLAGSSASKEQPVSAQGANIAGDPAAPNYVCSIQHVAVYPNRIDVYCWPGDGAIVYFDAPLSSATESRQTNRLLAILNTAVALNKSVVLWHNTNSAYNPPGCAANDCRLLEGLVITP